MSVLKIYDGSQWVSIPVEKDHGNLDGLSDDDHTQYLLVSGARAMTGALDMGTNLINNVTDPSSAQDAATKNYVDTQVTAQDLDFAGDSGTGAVDLDSQTFTLSGTANEIETSASGQTLTIGIVTSPTLDGTNFSGIPDGGLDESYLLADGTRAMTGDIDLGDNDLTNCRNYEGYFLQRDMPAATDDYVEIGSFTHTNASHIIQVDISCSQSAFTQAAHYVIPVYYNATGNTWQVATPISNTGLFSSGEFGLTINVNNALCSFRLWAKAGKGSLKECDIRVYNLGNEVDVFTEASGTGSFGATPETSYDPAVTGDKTLFAGNRDLPNTVDDIVEIGYFTRTNGAHAVKVSLWVSDTNSSMARSYMINEGFSTAGWMIAKPISSSGVFGTNDFDLDVQNNGNILRFRLRRTGGSTASNIKIHICSFAAPLDTWVTETGTDSVTAPTVYTESSFIENTNNISKIYGDLEADSVIGNAEAGTLAFIFGAESSDTGLGLIQSGGGDTVSMYVDGPIIQDWFQQAGTDRSTFYADVIIEKTLTVDGTITANDIVTIANETADSQIIFDMGEPSGDTGADSPNTGVSSATVFTGDLAWDSASASSASVFIPISGLKTHAWYVSNFGFSIPLNATIVGVEVKFTKGGSGAVVLDAIATLVDNTGNAVGDDKKDTGTNWVGGASATYGGAADDWSASLTPAIVNHANFGFGVSAEASFSSASVTASSVTIEITYTTLANTFTAGVDFATGHYMLSDSTTLGTNTRLTIDKDTGALTLSNTIATADGSKWDLQDYTAGAPTPGGYVKVLIDGEEYRLSAQHIP